MASANPKKPTQTNQFERTSPNESTRTGQPKRTDPNETAPQERTSTREPKRMNREGITLKAYDLYLWLVRLG